MGTHDTGHADPQTVLPDGSPDYNVLDSVRGPVDPPREPVWLTIAEMNLDGSPIRRLE